MAHERARVTKTGLVETVYSDFKTGFSVHPVKGDLTLNTNEDSVKRSIRNILLTNYSERPFQPLFGGNITALLFENFTGSTIATSKQIVSTAIKNYEPRAILHDVLISGNPDSNELSVKVVFSTKNRTEPDVLDIILERVR